MRWIAWAVLSFSRFPYFESSLFWIRLSLLVRWEIFALIALYLSLSYAISDVSSFTTIPEESDQVTFRSFTSIPIYPRGSISRVSLENATATEESFRVMEPRFRARSSTKGEVIICRAQGEVNEMLRSRGNPKYEMIQRIA